MAATRPLDGAPLKRGLLILRISIIVGGWATDGRAATLALAEWHRGGAGRSACLAADGVAAAYMYVC